MFTDVDKSTQEEHDLTLLELKAKLDKFFEDPQSLALLKEFFPILIASIAYKACLKYSLSLDDFDGLL